MKDVPAPLSAALVRDARERDVSLNEAAVEPLARKYGVGRVPSDACFVEPDDDPGVLKLRVPGDLRYALRRRAAASDSTIRGLVLQALAQHLGLPAESPKRRTRGAAS